MNDSLFPVLLYGLPLLAVYAWYLWRRNRNNASDADQLRSAVEAGMNEPASLHPVVDVRSCIGAGACTTECPEGALGVVDGKAVLINASACIGHGVCADACPTGALKLVFGTERRGVDIPVVASNFESNVPGLFIAGELGGMGLIRKAAMQGRQAVEALRKRDRQGFDYDLVIVGAGPAGIGGALAAQAGKLKYVILEQEDSLGGAVYHYPRNKVAMTGPVDLPLVGKVRFTEVTKERLLAFWNDIVVRTRLKINFRERMESIAPTTAGAGPGGAGSGADGFVVTTARGTYCTRSVLLAIGRRGTPRKLDVPGEEGPQVVYRLIDPAQYAGQHVLVVGGGDSALEAAISLAGESGTRVVLCHRGTAFNRVKPKNRATLEALEQAKKLKVLREAQVQKIDRGEVLVAAAGRSLRIRNDAVIVCTGGVLPTALLQAMGIEFQTKFGEA